MRPKGSCKELESRRRRAMELVEEGLSLNAVARQLGCHASSVQRRQEAVRAKGEEGLIAQSPPGRPPKLTAEQKEELVGVLLQGSLARGYRTDLWTTQRIAEVIESDFGVRYHRDHVGRLLHRLNWSHQKPERRAQERNEEEIERWKREEWPRIKKGRSDGRLPCLHRRIGIPADTERSQDLGAPRANTCVSVSLPSRQDLGDFGNHRESEASKNWVVLSSSREEYPASRSV